MKKIFTIILTLLICTSLSAAPLEKDGKERKPKKKAGKLEMLQKELIRGADTLTDAFLDTVVVKKALVVNDYSLIGIQYGAGLSSVMWNPRQEQKKFTNLCVCFLPASAKPTRLSVGNW